MNEDIEILEEHLKIVLSRIEKNKISPERILDWIISQENLKKSFSNLFQ